MTDFLKNDKTKFFTIGVLAATAGVKFLKSNTFKKGCVKTIAGGMKLRNEAASSLTKVKEEAQDMVYDEACNDKCEKAEA